MSNNSYIYLITNLLNGHKYIGQTTNLKRRWSQHCRKTNNKSVIGKAINKYGKENFSLLVLDICDIEDANEKEIYWIEKYGVFLNKYDYNCHIGGNMQFGENNPMYNKKGENCPTSKVDVCIGLSIYNDMKYNSIQTIYDLSYKYKLSTTIISEICKGLHWSTFGFDDLITSNYKTKNKIKLFKEEYLEIYNMYSSGDFTLNELSEKFGVDIVTISKICRGQHTFTKGMDNLLKNKRTCSKLTNQDVLNIEYYYESMLKNIKRKNIYENINEKYPMISLRTIQRICLNYDKNKGVK